MKGSKEMSMQTINEEICACGVKYSEENPNCKEHHERTFEEAYIMSFTDNFQGITLIPKPVEMR